MQPSKTRETNITAVMKSKSKAPIGIFDSGIGGLTVARAVMKAMPAEDIVYFGDTARVPYGVKSTETVREYALQITDFLLKKPVKMILIACNTVAAAAEDAIRARSGDVPVLGVVTAGAQATAGISITHNLIGVIGTLSTIGSGAYEKALKDVHPNLPVFSKACPLLVPLAEEGWTDNDVANQTVAIYLEDFKRQKLDALILGCTHYPLFRTNIENFMDQDGLQIIDSADSIAALAKKKLKDSEEANSDHTGTLQCYVSDKPQRFQQLAERFLGQPINRVEVVNLR
jgi:glutamate racemase